ncbi:DNA endonuclease [Mycobacterium phage Seagreen]|uniref:DNA endonuclease n=1 Tax=Mycobacterium phage Seagreen TaxID=1698713 RepID=UPI0006BD653C|nr:DNA endonuclease [Mycobacterium phage Seagreen]ALA48716.1 DNA endonuclease [Mycobacterium phage Seagreen]
MAKGLAGNKVRTITCAGCGNTVTRRMRPGQRFCSHHCYLSAPRAERRTGETRTCAHCGASFYIPRSRVAKGEGQFCSIGCHNANQGRAKTVHVCKVCGNEFRWSPSRSQSGAYRITYCSLACRDADPERRELLLRMNTAQQSGRTTRAERAGYALLDSLGVGYRRQVVFGGKFTPDAVVPAARLVLQFDGDYWHDRAGTSTEPRILRRVALDRSQDAYIRSCGWEVLRLWESDLRNDPVGCAERISQLLHRPLADEPPRDPLAPA